MSLLRRLSLSAALVSGWLAALLLGLAPAGALAIVLLLALWIFPWKLLRPGDGPRI